MCWYSLHPLLKHITVNSASDINKEKTKGVLYQRSQNISINPCWSADHLSHWLHLNAKRTAPLTTKPTFGLVSARDINRASVRPAWHHVHQPGLRPAICPIWSPPRWHIKHPRCAASVSRAEYTAKCTVISEGGEGNAGAQSFSQSRHQKEKEVEKQKRVTLIKTWNWKAQTDLQSFAVNLLLLCMFLSSKAQLQHRLHLCASEKSVSRGLWFKASELRAGSFLRLHVKALSWK